MNETYTAWITINFDRREEQVKITGLGLASTMDTLQATIEAKPDATSFVITLVRN